VAAALAQACVPRPLAAATVKAAASAGAVPARVAALTDGVVKTMLLTKLKVLAGSLVLAGLFAVAANVFWPAARTAAQPAAQAPAAQPGAGGVLVLDNCDPVYEGKADYADNVSLIDGSGKLVFRVSGMNNCESIGGSHMLARDAPRGWFWVLENVAHRVRKFDRTGKELLVLNGLHASAVAVHPPTGNLWVLDSEGTIEGRQLLVFGPDGKKLAARGVRGWDIAYDVRGDAFWVAGPNLTKVKAAGTVVFTKHLTAWCASCVAVHPVSGQAWVTVRAHPDVAGSKNEVLVFDNDGELQHRIDLGGDAPFHVSIDPGRRTAWVTLVGKAVRRYGADGKLEKEVNVAALAAQADPASGGVWVVTRRDTVLLSHQGEVVRSVPHKGETSQAWVVGW
jgi:hypothetical protein